MLAALPTSFNQEFVWRKFIMTEFESSITVHSREADMPGAEGSKRGSYHRDQRAHRSRCDARTHHHSLILTCLTRGPLDIYIFIHIYIYIRWHHFDPSRTHSSRMRLVRKVLRWSHLSPPALASHQFCLCKNIAIVSIQVSLWT